MSQQSSRKRERGASAVEYALLASGIAAVLVLAVFTFGGHVSDLFSNTCQAVVAQTHQTTC